MFDRWDDLQQQRRNAEAAAMASGPAPPPYSVEDPNRGRSCRSVDADNDSFDDGYMAVPAYDSKDDTCSLQRVGTPAYTMPCLQTP